MKIQVGEIYLSKIRDQREPYPNKTRKYLLPCLKSYGATFTVMLQNVFKIAVGVGDIVVSNRGLEYQKHLFILLDSTQYIPQCVEFLNWIRDQPMYQDDYVFHNIQKSKSHMVVIKLPIQYTESLKIFKNGEFSKMYTMDDINKYFKKNPDVEKVLIKDHNYRIVFAAKLNKKYGTSLNAREMDGELDFKPQPENEVFNWHLKKK